MKALRIIIKNLTRYDYNFAGYYSVDYLQPLKNLGIYAVQMSTCHSSTLNR